MRIMKTIRRSLIFTYSLISFGVICSLAVIFTFSMEKQFEEYAIKHLEYKISSVVKQINSLYNEDEGGYDIDQIEVVGDMALQNGLMIHLQTADGKIDWDIQSHKSDACQLMIDHVKSNMHGRYAKFDGEYQEQIHQIIINDANVGSLTIGFYGPYSYTDDELRLISNLSKYFIVFGIFFVIAAIVLGGIMSRKITEPISAVTEVARKITGGEVGAQTDVVSKTAETQQLIEDINRMSKKLELEEEQKHQITADVAHELRTPLTNLQGHLEAMIDGVWEPTGERLESCREEILRLTDIVKQLQELYVIENKKDIIKYEEFDFSALCEQLKRNFDDSLRRKNLKIKLETKTGDMVWGDQQRIMQCMVNLVSNAAQYSDPDASILISYAEKDEKSVVLQVRNRGTAIPEEILPHLFERFYRVDKSRCTKTGGMGIGLSITKAIVERHYGTIWAESEEGMETVFSIILPKKH